ncbi:MAG: hypothetical protein RLZZ221_1388 [Verrucomicrobiota bacterium]
MQLIRIHECLCDRTRLRIIHLLTAGPLCVCHFQAALREPQVKVSKHLAYLRTRGLVVAKRQGNWMVYSRRGPAANSRPTSPACRTARGRSPRSVATSSAGGASRRRWPAQRPAAATLPPAAELTFP